MSCISSSIIMGNVRLWENKMDELAALVRNQRDFCECSVLCFTEGHSRLLWLPLKWTRINPEPRHSPVSCAATSVQHYDRALISHLGCCLPYITESKKD